MDTPDHIAQRKARGDAVAKRWGIIGASLSQWMTTWQEFSDYMMPRKSGSQTNKESPGQIRQQTLWDATAEEAILTAAAGTITHLTPAGDRWMALSPGAGATDEVKHWFSQATDAVMAELYASDFYHAWHESLIDAFLYGTFAHLVLPSAHSRTHHESLRIGSYTIVEDHERRVVGLYRCDEFTLPMMVSAFGEESLSGCRTLQERWSEIVNGRGEGDPNKRWKVVHAIEPRNNWDRTSRGMVSTERPWTDDYVVLDAGNHVLSEGGYHSFPAAVCRVMRSNDPCEIFGRSPAFRALPMVKQLNVMEEDSVLAIELMVRPGWLMPQDSAFLPDNRPDGITFWDPSNAANRPEQLLRQNRVDIAEQKLEQCRQRVRNCFYNDLFRMFTNPDEVRRVKTAFEVAQMRDERLIMFTPMFSAITEQGLDRIIERTFDVLLRVGAIEQPPESIAMSGGDYKIEYQSKMALAIRAANTTSTMQGMEFIAQAAQIAPEMRHLIKWGKAGKAVLLNMGVPADSLNTEEEVADLMEMEAQQAAAAQQTALAAQSAEAERNMAAATRDAGQTAALMSGGGKR
jgi:hypothetical protein